MRRGLSIAKTTALEILSEPLSLLIELSALTLTVVAPALHYHQFGEATRMARDSGFSALLICGLVFVIFLTIRSFRREIESGTADMALAYAVSREGFFAAKTIGALVAFFIFSFIVFSTTMLMVKGAAIGGLIADAKGDVARIYGPFLAGGVVIMLLPLLIAAFQNRFLQCRFVISAFIWAFILSIVGLGVVVFFDVEQVVRYLPVVVLIVSFVCVMLAASAAFSIRLKSNGAASAVGIVLLASIPAIGNYYAVDALSNGRVLSLLYVAVALGFLLLAFLAFLLLGRFFSQGWRR